MLKHLLFFAIGAGLLACSSVTIISVHSENSAVIDQGVELNQIDSMITPYRTELESEMLAVIGVAKKDFIKGRPSGSLNNWAADAVLSSQMRSTDLTYPAFSLLNVGGLRNTINKGDVHLGDIFKVMPFDNEVVWAEMPVSVLEEIAEYLTVTGGEPIGGAVLKDGKLVVDGMTPETERVWIITSDYLLNGGDHMDFFEKRLSTKHTSLLLRDLMIEEVKQQGTLIWNDENRIVL